MKSVTRSAGASVVGFITGSKEVRIPSRNITPNDWVTIVFSALQECLNSKLMSPDIYTPLGKANPLKRRPEDREDYPDWQRDHNPYAQFPSPGEEAMTSSSLPSGITLKTGVVSLGVIDYPSELLVTDTNRLLICTFHKPYPHAEKFDKCEIIPGTAKNLKDIFTKKAQELPGMSLLWELQSLLRYEQCDKQRHLDWIKKDMSKLEAMLDRIS